MVLPSPAVLAQLARIVDYMTRNRLPAVYGDRAFVDAGGLMTYGPSMADAQRQSAERLDQVLQGAKPGDLPIQTPVRFQPVVNLRAARAIGLALPQSLLDRAEKIGE
jgi:putative ABC transport system substrate-binding protein